MHFFFSHARVRVVYVCVCVNRMYRAQCTLQIQEATFEKSDNDDDDVDQRYITLRGGVDLCSARAREIPLHAATYTLTQTRTAVSPFACVQRA